MNSNESMDNPNSTNEIDQLRAENNFSNPEEIKNKIFSLSKTDPSKALDLVFGFQVKVDDYLNQRCPELKTYFQEEEQAGFFYDGEKLKEKLMELQKKRDELIKDPTNKLGLYLWQELKILEQAATRIKKSYENGGQKKEELTKLDHQIGKFRKWSSENDMRFNSVVGYGGGRSRTRESDPNFLLKNLIKNLGDTYFEKLIGIKNQIDLTGKNLNDKNIQTIEENRRAIISTIAAVDGQEEEGNTAKLDEVINNLKTVIDQILNNQKPEIRRDSKKVTFEPFYTQH